MSIRFLAKVIYDGSKFNGFQIQPQVKSVQETLQNALSRIEKSPISIVGSGRTDAGVHALGQTFHFDTNLSMSSNEWKKALNSLLPTSLYIQEVISVNMDFHARYSATSKWYQYRISLNEFNPLEAEYVTHYGYPLDIEKMKQAAHLFVGTHSFHNFCSNHEEHKDMVKTITAFSIVENNGRITINVKGNGFLRYMIRLMVGTLIEIGRHHYEMSEITRRLDTLDSIPSVYKAPAQGLYLMQVFYEPQEEEMSHEN